MIPTHPLAVEMLRRDHSNISRQLDAARKRTTSTEEDERDRLAYVGRRERELAAHERFAESKGVAL